MDNEMINQMVYEYVTESGSCYSKDSSFKVIDAEGEHIVVWLYSKMKGSR